MLTNRNSVVKLFLILCCAVIWARDSKVNVAERKGKYIYDQRQIWGVLDETSSLVNKNGDLKTSTESSQYDPCLPYNPPKPSFSAPGRRVSEEKCQEYIWNVKVWQEKIKRDHECFVSELNGEKSPPGAIGGRTSLPGEFPHMGAIGWKAVQGGYVFKCGGTLISPSFVLTAAHCIRASPLDTNIEDQDPKIVRLTDLNLFNDTSRDYPYVSSDYNISRIILHPKYTFPRKYYDIALLELATEVVFTYKMQPACLWTKANISEFGNEVSLTGWGVLAQGGRENSPNLQVAEVSIIEQEQCDSLLENSRNRRWWGLTQHQLCAGKLSGGVDACEGDSGGPLQFRKPVFFSKRVKIYYVIGVTSFGFGCALPNHPGIYTRVSSFIDWIESYVWNK